MKSSVKDLIEYQLTIKNPERVAVNVLEKTVFPYGEIATEVYLELKERPVELIKVDGRFDGELNLYYED